MDTKAPSKPPLSKGIAVFSMVMIFLICATSYLAYPPPPKYGSPIESIVASETIVEVNPQQLTFEDMYPHEES